VTRALLNKIQNKEITLGVIGLGYVGYPLALTFAEASIPVVGFDINEKTVDSLNAGKSHIRHINHGRLSQVLEECEFRATSDFSEVRECDALIVAVPTPLTSNLEPDLSYIEATCKAIAPHLREGALVSLESTTWPGTCREVVAPILSETEIHLVYSPEREDPGNPEFCTKTIPKLLGADDPASLELGQALYQIAIEEIVPMSSTAAAETTKLFENIFRSVNIALVNELKVILDRLGVDVWEVIHAASTKPFGFTPFYPGPGLGGHCIPIDPFYLSWKAKSVGLTTRFIELAGEINRSMPHYVVGKVQDCLNEYGKALKGSKILVLGIAYKPNIDDMRESPALELMRLLMEKGALVEYHDPYFPEIGQTREYQQFLGKKSQPITGDYDCFLLATNHSVFNPDEILSCSVPVVDTRNWLPKKDHIFNA